jgi:pyruvate dehydrogenase E2 component (dihydrolipoamide acetyltransferase)
MPDKENDAPSVKEVGAGGKKSVRIRRLIERKMVDSWQHKPHFYVTIAVDMTDIIRFRKDLGITINDFVMAATSAALIEHPWVNSHWIDGEAIEQPEINLALAVATEGGLYYPVIKNVEQLSLKQLGLSAAGLAEKAHLGQLSDDDQQG